jgi:hypothetical protein
VSSKFTIKTFSTCANDWKGPRKEYSKDALWDASFTALLELAQFPLLRCFVICMTMMSDDEHILLQVAHDYARTKEKSLYDLVFGSQRLETCDMLLMGSNFAAARKVNTSVVKFGLSLMKLFVSLHLECLVQL